ncbi:MAG: hypothetical protein AAB472_03405 [Patescibacteria group bacterium]
MPGHIAELVAIGHQDGRRTIYDLITGGDAGGGEELSNLAYFSPLRAGMSIGRHYHEKMWETYLILSGQGQFSLIDIDSGESERIEITQVPFRITVPPRHAHTLLARTEMTLLIAATGEVSDADMIPYPTHA